MAYMAYNIALKTKVVNQFSFEEWIQRRIFKYHFENCAQLGLPAEYLSYIWYLFGI